MDSAASETYIRDVQRKNGKIIIRAIYELEGKVTFEAIVEKICEDFNVFNDRRKVERAVRGFLFRGYYLGIVDVNLDKSYKINDLIAEKAGQQYLASQGECLPRAAKRKCLKN